MPFCCNFLGVFSLAEIHSTCSPSCSSVRRLLLSEAPLRDPGLLSLLQGEWKRPLVVSSFLAKWKRLGLVPQQSHLIANHLPKEDLLDACLYTRHRDPPPPAASRRSVGQPLVWREVFLRRSRPGRHFLLIVDLVSGKSPKSIF